jgi:hypothetical protein
MVSKESERPNLGPNLGPIWVQRLRLAITERLLAIGAAATSRSLEAHRQIPADLGVKGREFKSRQPDKSISDYHTWVQSLSLLCLMRPVVQKDTNPVREFALSNA